MGKVVQTLRKTWKKAKVVVCTTIPCNCANMEDFKVNVVAGDTSITSTVGSFISTKNFSPQSNLLQVLSNCLQNCLVQVQMAMCHPHA